MKNTQNKANSIFFQDSKFKIPEIKIIIFLLITLCFGILKNSQFAVCSEIRGPIANCKNAHDNYYYKKAGLEQLSEDKLYKDNKIFGVGKNIFPELINELAELPEVTKNLLLTGKFDNTEDFFESLVYVENDIEDNSDNQLYSAINHDGSMLFSFNARVRKNAIVPIYYKRPVQKVPLEEKLTYYIHPLYLIADFLETDMSSKAILDIIEPLMHNITMYNHEYKKRNLIYCKKLNSIKSKVLDTEGGYHILHNLIKRKRSGSLRILKKLIQYGLDIHIFEKFPQLFTLAVRKSNHSIVRFILEEISKVTNCSKSEQTTLENSGHNFNFTINSNSSSSFNITNISSNHTNIYSPPNEYTRSSVIPSSPSSSLNYLNSSPSSIYSTYSTEQKNINFDFLNKFQNDDYSALYIHKIYDHSRHNHFHDHYNQSNHHSTASGGKNMKCDQSNLVNMVDNYNHTSLFYAVENNDLEMAKILISNGACINMWDPRTGQNPLMVALENHNGAMLSLIMDHGGDPLRISPISGLDVMDLAIKENDGKMIEKIVNHNNYDINTSDNDIGSIILEYATFQDKSELKLIGKTFKKHLNRDYFFKQLKDYEKEARHVLDIVKIRISDSLLNRLLKMESKKKVAIICQITDEDGRGALWWSAYYGNIKQIQYILDFYSKAIRNKWVGYQNCNPHKDDKYGIYPLNLIIRKVLKIPKKLIIDMLQFRDPQTNSTLVLQILTKSKQPLRALKSIIHTLKEKFNISYSFINIWPNGSSITDPIYYSIRKKLPTKVIYYLLEIAVKYSEEAMGSTSIWRRRVINSVHILKNVKNVDISSMLQLHESHFLHFDHQDGNIFNNDFNDDLMLSLKKKLIRNMPDKNERKLLKEPKLFFTNNGVGSRNIFDNKWRTNINFLLQNEDSQAKTPSNTIPPEDFPLVILPPKIRSIFSTKYAKVDNSPESIAKIILGRGPSHKSIENIRKLIEYAIGLGSDDFQDSNGYNSIHSSPLNMSSLFKTGNPGKIYTNKNSFGSNSNIEKSQIIKNGNGQIFRKNSNDDLGGRKSKNMIKLEKAIGKEMNDGSYSNSNLLKSKFKKKNHLDTYDQEIGEYESTASSSEDSKLSFYELSNQKSYYSHETSQNTGMSSLSHKRQFPFSSSSQSTSPDISSQSSGSSSSSSLPPSSYTYANFIPNHFLYPFGEASTDAIYSIVKLRPETIGEILTRVSYKSPSDAIRILSLLDALPSDFPPFNVHAYSPLQRAATILYKYKGQRDTLPVLHALLSSRFVQLFSSEQLMESLNLLALIDYKPSSTLELFGGIPNYCLYYGNKSGNFRYYYSKSGYWEMNSFSNEKGTIDDNDFDSSIGIDHKKDHFEFGDQSFDTLEEENTQYWNFKTNYEKNIKFNMNDNENEKNNIGNNESLSADKMNNSCPIKLIIIEKLKEISTLPWEKKLTDSDIMFLILCFFTLLVLFSVYFNSNLSFHSMFNSINKKMIKYSNQLNSEIPLSGVECNFAMDFGLVFMLNIPFPSKNNIKTGLWNAIKACFLINKVSDFPVKKYGNTHENHYESIQYSFVSLIIKFSNFFNLIKIISILIFFIWIVVFQIYEEIVCFIILTCIAIIIYTLHGFRIDENMYNQLSSCFKYNNALLLPEIMILYEQTNNQVIRIAKKAINLHSNLKNAKLSQNHDAKELSTKQIQKFELSKNNFYPENTYTEIPEIGLLEISKFCYNNVEKIFKCYRLLFIIQVVCLILSFLITIKLPFNCYNNPEFVISKDWKYSLTNISFIFNNINSCRKLYQFQYPHLFQMTRFYPLTVSILHFIAFIYYWQLLSMISSPILSIILALYHFYSLASVFSSAISTPISILLPNAKNSKLLISQSYSSKEISRTNSVSTPLFSGEKQQSKDKQSSYNKSLIIDEKNSIISSNGCNSPSHVNLTKNSSINSLKTQSNSNIRLQSVGEIANPGSFDISNMRNQSGNNRVCHNSDNLSLTPPHNTLNILQNSNPITTRSFINNQSPEIRLSNFLKLNHYSTEIQYQDYEHFEMNYSKIYPYKIENNSETSYYQVLEAQIYPFFIWADSRRASHRICKYFWKPIDFFKDVLAIVTISFAMMYYYVELKSLPIKTIRLWNLVPIFTLLLSASLIYIMYIMIKIHNLTVEFWQWVPDVYDILPICSNLLNSVETTMRLLPFLTSPFYILNTPVKLPLLFGSIFMIVISINFN
ncbi:ankyrin repeats containing protein [Cryptosporidium ubiquitum]|uniref:Ankyrin repeats containing protein n=1 Tax=Cryptosporidium ubiquitum TaxID=857276 RepID=A0A1J4MFH1_9CRYT|nr:ankyrin repeats containing protein [Cryptosporidium ubiquitum]OII72211.1 ankyrin repeats containing protein [Cryptosporidium ubiquitum]